MGIYAGVPIAGAGAYKSPMDIRVHEPGVLVYGATSISCALGLGGVSGNKLEGDGTTPAGRFPLRRVMYRPDRLDRPETALPVRELRSDDGWCDAPGDPEYNRLVRLPHGAGFEPLWRADGIYDVLVELGYNDDPVIDGRGSAVFLHLARAGYPATEGCVALALGDLLALLAACPSGARLVVSPDPP